MGDRHRRPCVVMAGSALLAGVLFSSCGEGLTTGRAADAEDGPFNLLVYCVDTLRADRVGVYGHPRPTTPTIDALARKGVLFEKAQATAPWTVPSVASILTSLMPSQHGSLRRGRVKRRQRRPQKLRDDVDTLAGVLGEAGYRTAFFSGNAFIRGRVLEDFDEMKNDFQDAAQIRDAAERWVAEDPETPFLLYLQPFDLHVPIEPPDPYADMFGTASGTERLPAHAEWHYSRVTDFADAGFLDFAAHKTALYDGALRYVDETLDEILDRLAELGLADRTYVVVTSDHGEEFWDHASVERHLGGDPRRIWGIDHGHSMFQELLRVPLVVAGPGIARGRSLDCPFSLIDLAPTLLDLVDVPPSETMQGVSRASFLRPGDEAVACSDTPLFAESPAYGIRRQSVLYEGRYKLVQRGDGVRLLYDLEEDPAELDDLASERPELVAGLSALLRANRRHIVAGEEMDIDPQTLETLRSLGYID